MILQLLPLNRQSVSLTIYSTDVGLRECRGSTVFCLITVNISFHCISVTFRYFGQPPLPALCRHWLTAGESKTLTDWLDASLTFAGPKSGPPSLPRCTEPALVYPGLADKRELLHPTGYALTVKLGAGI